MVRQEQGAISRGRPRTRAAVHRQLRAPSRQAQPLFCGRSSPDAGFTGKNVDVRRACAEFLAAASEFYRAPTCGVRVLAARPPRVREHGTTELFGDYHIPTMAIRRWMRTAVRKEVTSFGTFLATLCHEFNHHLDYHLFRFPDLWHTRGFYERTAALYHLCEGNAAQTALLGASAGRTLADRLAAHQSACVSLQYPIVNSPIRRRRYCFAASNLKVVLCSLSSPSSFMVCPSGEIVIRATEITFPSRLSVSSMVLSSIFLSDTLVVPGSPL